MATIPELSNNPMGTNIIIQFNPASQLPIKLSGGQYFATWKAQFSMLMYGYNLFGHLDGTTPTNSSRMPIMASVEPTITSNVVATNSAKSAWDALHTTYANKSQTRVFNLHDQLARVTKDSRSITEYLHTIRSFSDELAIVGAPVSNPEFIVKILSGLGPEFREISTAIRAHDTAISYEELFEKLLDFELFLRHKDAKKLPSTITTAVATPTKFNSNNRNNHRQTNNSQQWCQNSRPSTPPQWQSNSNPNAKANYAVGFTADTNPWIADSGATHHITIEPHNLQPYRGNEDVSMGDGSENAEATSARSDQQ
ncbi:hypothetical protein KY284_008165 [Solanum tuberosum]|nr:hypothetical protein KY284_008165 [Solanum tuberosum]